MHRDLEVDLVVSLAWRAKSWGSLWLLARLDVFVNRVSSTLQKVLARPGWKLWWQEQKHIYIYVYIDVHHEQWVVIHIDVNGVTQRAPWMQESADAFWIKRLAWTGELRQIQFLLLTVSCYWWPLYATDDGSHYGNTTSCWLTDPQSRPSHIRRRSINPTGSNQDYKSDGSESLRHNLSWAMSVYERLEYPRRKGPNAGGWRG